MIRIKAASHRFQIFDKDNSPDSLDETLATLCREKYRRIDRFVQLALIGARECVSSLRPHEHCGLFLSSGVGPAVSNVALQDAIHRHKRYPMPFTFVNTLGSSACYHVARELDLKGEAMMLARRRGSFTAALQCAVSNIESGITNQALVGAVEECIQPIERHWSVMRDSNILAAEGSHWLLLETSDNNEEFSQTADIYSNRIFDTYESADAAAITSFVTSRPDLDFAINLNANGIELRFRQRAF